MSDSTQSIQIVASLLGGGAVGAIITIIATWYRGRVQVVGRRVEVSPLFASGFAASTVKTNVSVSDGDIDYKFPNLYVADVQIVNRGNRDLNAFSFGITLAPSDKAVHVEPYGLDRHHVANLTTVCTPASPACEIDFELRPFNRKDSYTMKVLIVANSAEPGPITIGSAEAVRFTEIPSLAEMIAKAASSVTLLKMGPFEISFPK